MSLYRLYLAGSLGGTTKDSIAFAHPRLPLFLSLRLLGVDFLAALPDFLRSGQTEDQEAAGAIHR